MSDELRLKPGEVYKPNTFLIPPSEEGEKIKLFKVPVANEADDKQMDSTRERPSVITLCKVWGREKDQYYWGCDTEGDPSNASNEADNQCRADGNSFCATPICRSDVDSCDDRDKV